LADYAGRCARGQHTCCLATRSRVVAEVGGCTIGGIEEHRAQGCHGALSTPWPCDPLAIVGAPYFRLICSPDPTRGSLALSRRTMAKTWPPFPCLQIRSRSPAVTLTATSTTTTPPMIPWYGNLKRGGMICHPQPHPLTRGRGCPDRQGQARSPEMSQQRL
jgi:hypothetical protein